MKFSELSLQPTLATAIQNLGYDECTPIQTASMPVILDGKDVAGLAQTGTGKTAAFVIPMMDRILRGRAGLDKSFKDWKPHHFVLILVPTRELAEQVFTNVQTLGQGSNINCCAVYGGTSYDKQKEMIHKGVEFIVATPGRLIDLFKENIVDLKQVRAIIFDEADRMFDMGFKDDMKYILQRVPRERQLLVFSATLNFDVLNTAYMFGAEPVEIDVSRDQAKAENVKDVIFHLGQDEKPAHLLSLIKLHKPRQTIIFSNFKTNVEKIASFLTANGVPAMAISSLLTQGQRNRVIEQFKAENDLNILVATDVAARGLDIKGVDLVVNFEIPQDAENYVHRIGRTGRAGAEGKAFSFVSDKDVENMSRVEDYLKHKVPIEFLEDKDLIKDYKPFVWENHSRSLDDYADQKPRGGRSDRGGERRDGRRGGERGEGRDRRPNRGPRQERSGGRPDHRHNDSRSDARPDSRGEARDNRGEARPDNRGEARTDNRGAQGNRDRKFDKRDRRPREGQPTGQSQNGRHSGDRKHAGGRHEGDKRDQNRNRSHKAGEQRKPSVHGKVIANQKSAGIGGKITGFLKKIFGK